MKNVLSVFIISVCFYCVNSQAQMIDVLSGLGIQGQLSAQSVNQIGTAFSKLQQNELINKLNILIMDAKTIPNRSALSKSRFTYNLSPLDWNIGADQQNKFYITLNNIDKSSCSQFIYSLNYHSVYVNNKKTTQCADKNVIKFIFD